MVMCFLETSDIYCDISKYEMSGDKEITSYGVDMVQFYITSQKLSLKVYFLKEWFFQQFVVTKLFWCHTSRVC